jgi:hypothetical protein
LGKQLSLPSSNTIKRTAKVLGIGGNLLENKGGLNIGNGIEGAVFADENGGFLEINLLTRPLRVGRETIHN